MQTWLLRARMSFVVAVLGAAVSVGGCSGDSDSRGKPAIPAERTGPSPGGTAKDGGVDGAKLATADALIVFECGLGEPGSETGFKLSAWSARDGRRLAAVQVPLPDKADLAWGCGSGGNASSVRQMFDRDLTTVAVALPVGNGTGARAGAVNLITGAVVGPTPADEGFGRTPREGDAVIHPRTGDLWYIDAVAHKVMSRPLTAAAPTTDHGPDQGSGLVLTGNTHWMPSFVGSSGFAANPSGTYGAFTTFNETLLQPRQAPESSARAFDRSNVPGTTYLPGDKPAPMCGPQLWLDDHRLICRTADNLALVTFADDYSAVASTRDLLPANDRQPDHPVVSRDGASIAFLATQGDRQSLYTQDLAPGATPRKVVDLPPGTRNRYLIEWR
ncbi:hypothetical protein [Embleya sp. NPDC059237]|uniref:hypothetical protein n=1 Tax=Embleya sp. NPDC059237 TaxID=3346784 RepID=UPI003693C416